MVDRVYMLRKILFLGYHTKKCQKYLHGRTLKQPKVGLHKNIRIGGSYCQVRAGRKLEKILLFSTLGCMCLSHGMNDVATAHNKTHILKSYQNQPSTPRATKRSDNAGFFVHCFYVARLSWA
jgi:hypothetical protein